jgi:hypothetical protein
MTPPPNLPLAEVTTIALRVLIQEIGVVNTARFINQYIYGFGDYTQEREELFKDVTIDAIVQAMKSREGEENS